MHTCLQQLVFVAETAVRPGIKVDTTKSQVPDPNSIPAKGSKALPATIWRVDRLREMTYTQFWQLIQERQIERVCCNNASVSVLPYIVRQHVGYAVHDNKAYMVCEGDKCNRT